MWIIPLFYYLGFFKFSWGGYFELSFLLFPLTIILRLFAMLSESDMLNGLEGWVCADFLGIYGALLAVLLCFDWDGLSDFFNAYYLNFYKISKLVYIKPGYNEREPKVTRFSWW